MSEEEKNAIDYLKVRLYGNEGCEFINVNQEDLRIMLNLINKYQQKIGELILDYNKSIKETNNENKRCSLLAMENQELKESIKELTEAIEEWINGERINDIKHISKDKIRELINKRNLGMGYTSLECVSDIEKLLEEK